jgi:RNA polymerase sigma-70 factor (ECF subfamily)
MSGDSLPFALPLPRIASRPCEATALYGELRKPLLRYLVCLGLSVDEAHDVVQEAFLSLHRHLTAGGSKENIRSWLFRVAHNRARNQQTCYDRRFATPLDEGVESKSISEEATPEQAVLEKERFERLDRAMGLLPAGDRECLLLRAEGLRYREIAEVLGMATSTVAETVHRAIKKLGEQCNV